VISKTLDSFARSLLHCSPWESRPDVHESMHHATRVRNDSTLTRAGRQATIGGAIFVFRNHAVVRCDRDTVTQSERKSDHMMQRTLTRIDSPRFTGARRSAASWRAPVGANGVGSYAIAIGLDRSKRHMCGQWCMRRVEQAMGREQQSFRTSMSGDRPLDAVKSGAGSRRSEGTP
jgi:hypothetical protein